MKHGQKSAVFVITVTCALFGIKVLVFDLDNNIGSDGPTPILAKVGSTDGHREPGDRDHRRARLTADATRSQPVDEYAEGTVIAPQYHVLRASRASKLASNISTNNEEKDSPVGIQPHGQSQNDTTDADRGQDAAGTRQGSDPRHNFRNLPETLYRMAPKIFDGVPTSSGFLPEFKNPCWRASTAPSPSGQEDAALQCLPYFFLAGMPKSGTTDIHVKLHKHRQIIKETVKEPHWWARERFNGRSLQYYIEDRSVNIAPMLTRGDDPNIIIGDASASTFWDNRAWRRFFPNATLGPVHHLAEIIHTVLPHAKIIVVFRNPIERLYSDFNYFNKVDYDLGPSIFHNQVLNFTRQFQKCLNKTMDYRTCAYDLQTFPKTRVTVGMYPIYLSDWLNVFPRDQIKVLRLEDWNRNCTDILPELFDFLHLSKMDSADIARICSRHPSNVNRRKSNPMLQETRRILGDFYQPLNKDLAEMLQDDKYLWQEKD